MGGKIQWQQQAYAPHNEAEARHHALHSFRLPPLHVIA
jgi:hypothetical protein